MTVSSKLGGGRVPKNIRLKTLTQIMSMALQTGEYRDPGFREEISDILDEVCAEEIDQIRMIADYERRLMLAEIEILHLKAEHAIDMKLAETQIKLERRLNEIFREISAGNFPAERDIKKKIGEVDTTLDLKTLSELAPGADADFDKSQYQRLLRLEGFFRRMMPGYRGPTVL